ncbi:MAG: cytidylyltransferase [Gammaproteobacteria bacterium]|jgi:nicotinamide mononucleotide (NMN) deamidase PncC|nr:cytidylyltransferase [Gammaproteobacteria bacterium]MBQ09238.1 cytidylyltransferase [Gammaproteobacteria bacterium]MDP6146232.1 cytidylyltransferase [Gammaproteobacteria bacterium]HJL80320.1 cytidylyltransferase [Gammaproteobacteria bacterium]HJM09641.1 cytidylyltransferase [Gammaproteobacteria bacterium]|tara:strand:+ start:40192 stop:41310 length:1119 start_codon:yes stop_codon:yes gene_type:complete
MDLENIQSIHTGPFKLVYVSSGGGSTAISDFLKVPGASNTILESYIPYSRESMDEYLGIKPSHYCGLQTTINMAMIAFNRAQKLAPDIKRKCLLGAAVTATLSTTYEKIGSHRFFVCIHGSEATHVISCYLTKGKRTRDLEEELVSECLEALIGIACGVSSELPKLSQNIEYEVVSSQKDWKKLIDREIDLIKSEEEISRLIFPGTFSPIHEGHLKIKEIAEAMTQQKLFFEISVSNVDKTPLSFYEIQKTIDQFSQTQQWVLTNAPTFQQKIKLFPKSTFVVGTDTLMRIFDEKYYQDQTTMNEALECFNDYDARFIVFGREIDKTFHSLKDLNIPPSILHRFEGVSENVFRMDIRSRDIKRSKEESKRLA